MIRDHLSKGRMSAALREVVNTMRPLTTVHCKFKDTIKFEGVNKVFFGGR